MIVLYLTYCFPKESLMYVCVLFNSGISDFKQGGVLVVPHSSVKSSIAHALGGKAGVSLTGLHHMTLGLKDGWTINLNEADINNVR